MMGREDARAAIYTLDPERLARRVWRASRAPDGSYWNAAAFLDLRDGRTVVRSWPPGRHPARVIGLDPGSHVMVAAASATARMLIDAEAEAGPTPPSDEVLEEEVAREVWAEVVWTDARRWPLIEAQLTAVYGRGEGAA